MTYDEVLNIVKSANSIKKHETEYYIYSDNGFALVYHNAGKITSFLADVNGEKIAFTKAQKQQLQAVIDLYFENNKKLSFGTYNKLK